MNIKQKDFMISNMIVVIFTILIVLIFYNFITAEFGFDQNNFLPVTLFLLLLGGVLYYFLSAQLFEPLFKSEENIENHIKETLHELNTPVATIQINSKILQKKEKDEKNLSRLNRIDESCDSLLNLYNQMEYSIKEQIDSISTEAFDISEIIEKSLLKHHDLKADISIFYEKKSYIIKADKNGFERVFDNLLINAIKYNKKNGTITIQIKDDILSIKDTGIGIDTKNLFQIFDKYYQENNHSSGVGLGLNIIKAYCDRYKIDIKIDSLKDEWSLFSLNLKGVKWQ
ncbi:sensor histidine kinase [Arcobacter sp. 15-2]|uniref:sensor histidine kinase n=1 Tax=Arcobacter sp. 15-2 TaxID=3374109 RepID=UPI00399C5DBF